MQPLDFRPILLISVLLNILLYVTTLLLFVVTQSGRPYSANDVMFCWILGCGFIALWFVILGAAAFYPKKD